MTPHDTTWHNMIIYVLGVCTYNISYDTGWLPPIMPQVGHFCIFWLPPNSCFESFLVFFSHSLNLLLARQGRLSSSPRGWNLQWPLPCAGQIGVGSLFHGVAMSGPAQNKNKSCRVGTWTRRWHRDTRTSQQRGMLPWRLWSDGTKLIDFLGLAGIIAWWMYVAILFLAILNIFINLMQDF